MRGAVTLPTEATIERMVDRHVREVRCRSAILQMAENPRNCWFDKLIHDQAIAAARI